MPLIRENKQLPQWSEVTYFDIIDLTPGEVKEFVTSSPKELIFIAEGIAGYKPGISDNPIDFQTVTQGSIIDASGYRVVTIYPEEFVKLIRIGGFWKDETGTRGFFSLEKSQSPKNDGDPASYEKERNTDFDNHYHDFDEYWIIYEGRGRAVSEGIFYDVQAGDCIATQKGHYHDFPVVHETIKGIWFETTLLGEKRLGHLWKRNLKQ